MSRTAQSADGKIHEFPDETSDAVMDRAMREYAQGTIQPRTKSEEVWRGITQAGRYLTETPFLVGAGLTDLAAKGANIGISGLSKAAQAVGDKPINYRLPTDAAQTVYEGFSDMGFPEPETDLDRFGERLGRTAVGAMAGPLAGARMAASSNPVVAGTGQVLKQAPSMQYAGSQTGASTGFLAKEAGANPYVEMLAELGGGMVAPVAAGAGRTVAATGRTAAGVKDVLTESGQRKIVGNVLDDSATDTARATRNIDDNLAFGSGISEKTTGQASRDPGLLTLERATRHMDQSGRFSQKLSEANMRRQTILDVLGGEDVAISKANRNVSTGAQREAALGSATSGVQAKPIFARIDAMLASAEGTRKVVRNALNTVKKDIEGFIGDDGTIPARRLYELRKDINDAMQGKFRDPKRADFKMAKGQLKQVKNIIDAEIERVAPGFRKYLEDYAKLSRDIDRRGVVQNIQERSTVAASDPMSGREVLSQAKFKRMVNAERTNGVLSDDQLTVMSAIADDLDSGQAINSATVRPPGSDTAKNLTVAHVLGRATGGNTNSPFLNAVIKPVKWITNFSEEQVQGLLVEAMLDPQLARMLLAEANPAQVHRASIALTQLPAYAALGAATGSAAQSLMPETQPEEITTE